MHRFDENASLIKILESWITTSNPYNSTEDIVEWISQKNRHDLVRVKKIDYAWDGFWRYDKAKGAIANVEGTFFEIVGGRRFEGNKLVAQQPIIVQDEIGYLGIIGKVINGTMYFLMQAKVEPGNVNKYQISPTIQATRSNFMRVHGGKEPAYLRYFSHKERHEVIADQIQSEQSSRFLGKRNRNIIIVVKDDIELLPSHRWMTLGQINELMCYDNLVNMDTRTVLSCIPFALRDYSYRELEHIRGLFNDGRLFDSLFFGHAGKEISRVYQYMNDAKMLEMSRTEVVDLQSLEGWYFDSGEFKTDNGPFKVVFCEIEVEGREVQRWQQPLIEAAGQSTFGLVYRNRPDYPTEFLVQAKTEIGCFDKIELAPSVQTEPGSMLETKVDRVLEQSFATGEGVRFEGVFSEEGGRFYQEQNRNVICEVNHTELSNLPDGYFWADWQTLNILVQFNNCLNIQLRNLISLLSPRGFINGR